MAGRRHTPVPTDERGLDRLIKKIGALLSQQTAEDSAAKAELAPLLAQRRDLNDRIRELKATQGTAATQLARDIEEVLAAIYAFVGPRWADFAGTARSFARPGGTLKLRRNASRKVVVVDAQSVIERYKELGLLQFLNITYTLNKQAMMRDPDRATSVTGVTIQESDSFAVVPAESQSGARAFVAALLARRKPA